MSESDEVRAAALPLEGEGDLDPLLDRVGAARCVLLGEASHGTHEFYAWRAALTRRLVAEHGFSFVAVEGDWPDCWDVHRCVTLQEGAPDDPKRVLDAYRRWPSWMWANQETVEFCRWLRDRNSGLPGDRRTGFYGLDVYSLWESLRAVMLYLYRHRPDHVDTALAAYRCFQPYGEDPQAYALERSMVPDGCRGEVTTLLAELRREWARPGSGDQAECLDALQNAEVAAGAEHYYRSMIGGGPEAWNVRDVHMADTLDRLLAFHGPAARGVVWAHNTHIGDSDATNMAQAGMVNLGRLARERHSADRVVLVGFAGGAGHVVAASRWGGPMEVMTVPAPRPGSLEALLTEAAPPRALFVLPAGPAGERSPGDLSSGEGSSGDPPGAAWLTEPRGHRAIGVVYDPDRDRGNFVPTRLSARYDALCWFRRTSALHPLHLEAARRGEFETLPTGV